MPKPMGPHKKEVLMEIDAPKENRNPKNEEGDYDQAQIFPFGFDQIPDDGNQYSSCGNDVTQRNSCPRWQGKNP